MPDEIENRTPEGWRDFLLPKLNEQAEACILYRDYYGGKHRISGATSRFRNVFGRYFPNAADNWMQVIVDASVERLGVNGFRYGDDDEGVDQEAKAVWDENKLDNRQRQLFTEAVKCGKAFVLVDKTQTPARITFEHPLEVYVHHDPDTGERVAAVKRWQGDDNHSYVTLYLPGRVYKWKSRGKVRNLQANRASWEWRGTEAGIPVPPDHEGKPFLPMIPVENNRDMLDGGVSDLEVVIPIQDRVNKLCLDLDVGSEFYAAPQRWAAGWEPPLDADGQPLPQTEVAAATSRFLAFSDPETKVGSLPAGDPKAYTVPIEMYVQHMAALSRVPPHYLLGRMVNISGDALKGAETGLVAKCSSKQDDFSDPLEEAVSYAIDKDPAECEAVWRDAESRTFGQLVDGVVKLRQEVALPLEMAWEMVGLTPNQVARAKKLIGLPERDFQALDQGLAMKQQMEAQRARLAGEAQQTAPGQQERQTDPDASVPGSRGGGPRT